MARIKRTRRVESAPDFEGFRPYGLQKSAGKEVVFHFEEYEAVKLCDYDQLTHAEAAALMGVSRATFTRVYQAARNKIARAFAEAAPIRMEHGYGVVNLQWYYCPACEARFSIYDEGNSLCPVCLSADVSKTDFL